MPNLPAKHPQFHTVGAFLVFLGFSVFFKFVVVEPRKKIYAEFYRNYDSMKDSEKMKKGGSFQSAT